MSINPSIFKAYDVRGLYPSEVNEEAARQIGRGFVAYLDARRIAVSRDMRLSSPSVAAAFIEGARAQGADVVDYGMMGTDMMYYAVARDGLPRVHRTSGMKAAAAESPNQRVQDRRHHAFVNAQHTHHDPLRPVHSSLSNFARRSAVK